MPPPAQVEAVEAANGLSPEGLSAREFDRGHSEEELGWCLALARPSELVSGSVQKLSNAALPDVSAFWDCNWAGNGASSRHLAATAILMGVNEAVFNFGCWAQAFQVRPRAKYPGSVQQSDGALMAVARGVGLGLRLLLALTLLVLLAFGLFIVNVQLEIPQAQAPALGPAWQFSVQLGRVRAKPKVTRIPQQLVLTSKEGTFASLPKAVQRNVRHTLALNPWVSLRWLGDKECESYLMQHYNHTELPMFFKHETRGSYRSDVCRAAVLAREGGFYTDLDVEMKWSFQDLAGNETTFLASYSEDGSVLNAMMGAVANSSFMEEMLRQLTRFYRGEPVERYGSSSEWMGPVTALAGLKAVAARDCPRQDLQPEDRAQFNC
ncbi:unnamed protein product, partial [Effrenium voratum]